MIGAGAATSILILSLIAEKDLTYSVVSITGYIAVSSKPKCVQGYVALNTARYSALPKLAPSTTSPTGPIKSNINPNAVSVTSATFETIPESSSSSMVKPLSPS
jgi:hypothetical protein